MTQEYSQLETWQKAFHDLNMKLGNDVWGACLEDGGNGKMMMVIYINSPSLKQVVLDETKGRLAGYETLLEVYPQEEYAKSLAGDDDEQQVASL